MRFGDDLFDCIIDFFEILMFVLKKSGIDVFSFSLFLLNIDQSQVFLDPNIELLGQRVSFAFDQVLKIFDNCIIIIDFCGCKLPKLVEGFLDDAKVETLSFDADYFLLYL